MNKKLKAIIIVISITILITGVIYAMKQINKQKTLPTATITIEEGDMDTMWVGTFQLVWNEFMDKYVKGNVEFIDGESKIAKELNKKSFTKEMLNDKDYYIEHGLTNKELQKRILTNIKNKFNVENSAILKNIEEQKFEKALNHYTLYAMLNKNFTFNKPFDLIPSASKFNNGEKNVKYFGIEGTNGLEDNIKVMFYNDSSDFAVTLKTKENEEVILYRTENRGTFEELYKEILQKENLYSGSKEFKTNDDIKVPYIEVNKDINYNELCNREIKNCGIYIDKAIQSVNFNLTEHGGNLVSEAINSGTIENAISMDARKFYFTDTFVLFLKEKDKEKPYFALLVNSDEILKTI